MNTTKPNINVTPLIDVLLVLLIIFMVVSPLKPTAFKAKIPQESKQTSENSNPHTLIVSLNADSTIKFNNEDEMGSIDNPQKLVERLSGIFLERSRNQVYAEESEFRSDLNDEEKIQKTVFIKAPRRMDYGKVVKLIDALKISGATPISLQIDDLN